MASLVRRVLVLLAVVVVTVVAVVVLFEDETSSPPLVPGTSVDNDPLSYTAGREDEFAAAYRAAVAQLEASEGFRSARLNRGIESPSRFVLLVEWETLEAHTVSFRESERFTRWRELIGPYFDGPPRVEHFVPVSAELP